MSSIEVARPRLQGRRRKHHPVAALVLNRVLLGIVTLFMVSIITFAATQLLPGNAAQAVLGQSATPARVHALELQMGLDQSAPAQYWSWLTGIFHGDFGESLSAHASVSSLVGPRITNSAALVLTAGLIGTLLGVGLGLLAALRRDGVVDHVLSVGALGVTALPEFVVGIILILVFATNVFQLFPAVSTIPPGTSPWSNPEMLVLPTATLVIIIIPYIFRMMRAATVEALESEYVEMARLKGLSSTKILLKHALPNAVAPTIQAIGLSLLYLAGGIVIVEVVFNYPGLGLALDQAVVSRDVPTIQFIVIFLAAIYVVVNILADVATLLASPRRRLPR